MKTKVHTRKCFKRCQQVRGDEARHVRPLGRVFARFRVFAFKYFSFEIDVLLEEWPTTTGSESAEMSTSVNQPKSGRVPPATHVGPQGYEAPQGVPSLYLIWHGCKIPLLFTGVFRCRSNVRQCLSTTEYLVPGHVITALK